MDHNKYIQRTLELARLGAGKVSPNPLVGSVIVKDNRIISEGYHDHFGGPHAEINALKQVSGQDLKPAYLYVNLEPCSHHGKTLPCAEAIIESGISNVVYGMEDPNPRVSGCGLQMLRQAGVHVIGPVLEKECINLNVGFIKSILRSIPWITVKIAQTLDGKIASADKSSEWITCDDSRRLVHQWRSEHDAVLIGIQTVFKDNPRLNVRYHEGVSPKRIILDRMLGVPLDAKIIQENPENTWIISSKTSDPDKKKRLSDLGVHVLTAKCTHDRIDLSSVWKNLIETGICSVFVEGGQQVFTTFLNSKWVDSIRIFIAPRIFGKGLSSLDDCRIESLKQIWQFSSTQWKSVGEDILFKGNITCLQDWLKK